MVGIVVILQLSHDGDCRDGTESVYGDSCITRFVGSAKSQSLEGFAIPDRSCFDQLRNDKVRSW